MSSTSNVKFYNDYDPVSFSWNQSQTGRQTWNRQKMPNLVPKTYEAAKYSSGDADCNGRSDSERSRHRLQVDIANLLVSLAASETSSTVIRTFEDPFSDKFFLSKGIWSTPGRALINLAYFTKVRPDISPDDGTVVKWTIHLYTSERRWIFVVDGIGWFLLLCLDME